MEILFQAIGWEKVLFTPNSFENTRVVVEYRDVGVEMEKW